MSDDAGEDKAAEARSGLLDAVAGKAKEVAGAVTGKDDLVEQGQLQQAEATKRRQAVADDAIAEAKHDEASRHHQAAAAEAAQEKCRAQAQAARHEEQIAQDRAEERAAADGQAARQEAAGQTRAEQTGAQVAEARLGEAEVLTAGAAQTQLDADTQQRSLDRQADEAEAQARALRAQNQE